MKFLRAILFYIVYFFVCMFVVVAALERWPAGTQMLFAFGVPGILVWVQERRRAELAAARVALQQRMLQEELAKAKRARLSTADSPPATDKSARVSSSPWDNLGLSLATISAAPDKAPSDRNRVDERGTAQMNGAETATPAKRAKGWVPAGESVVVGGQNIGGMVYVGVPLRSGSLGYNGKSRPFIDPSLHVAKIGSDIDGAHMPYWPGYSDIPPMSRATYLDWLAGGRADPSYDVGYMFLYFYGLERRFLFDNTSEVERRQILAEAIRLRDLYRDNGSARRYLGDFIEVAKVTLDDPSIHDPVLEKVGWDVPFSMKVALGGTIAKGEALTANQLLGWFLNHPESRLRTAAERCGAEFRALFRIRFDARFENGLSVTRPRKLLEESYHAASGEFDVALTPEINGARVPDISGVRKPIEIAQEIADEVMDDLDKFSRYLGRNPEGRGSVEAHALLPRDLWTLFPSQEIDALRDWARERCETGGLVPVVDLIERLENAAPQKLGARRLTNAADALARVGFGFAPDSRFSLRAPKVSEPVVLFELGDGVDRLEDVSDAYRSAQIELALGAYVAHADGDVADVEREALHSQLQSRPNLSAMEARRLSAELDWMLAVPPDIALLRRNLKNVGAEQQVAIRAAISAAVHADGIVQAAEVAGVEKLYKLLDFDPALAYADLHAGGAPNEPVSMRPAVPGRAGEAIPPDRPARLDAARIAAIRTDTARVSSVLGKIFANGDEDDEDDEVAAVSSPVPGLDHKHAFFARDVILQPHWDEPAFEALAAKHGLMPAGALETLNEWAFDEHGEALLDDYDGYHVDFEIAVAIMTQVGLEARA